MSFFTLALVLVMLYAAVVFLACVGWLLEQSPAGSGSGQSIQSSNDLSLVVPFRNEEKNLLLLLNSIAEQAKKIKIILVNDHSTDASLQVIENFIEQNPLQPIMVLTNTGEGKKAASATGLKAVTTSKVVFTDADCQWPEHFLERLETDTADFFYGPVVYGLPREKNNPVFFLDQLALNSLALGLGQTGIHTYCSGANMGGKTGFLQTAVPQLERANNLSGDDVSYLQHAVAQKKRIHALTHRELTVCTQALPNLGSFLRQRLRWGQKAPAYRGFALPALSVLVALVSCMVLVVLIGCISGFLSPSWGVMALIKLCIDLLFLFLVALRLRLTRFLWAFLPAWLLNLMYIPAVAVLGLFINPTWKGRKVKPRNGSTTR